MTMKQEMRTVNISYWDHLMVGVLGIIVSLFFVGKVFADDRNAIQEQAFEHLGDLIRQEAANKDLPMLSVLLVDEDGVIWSDGVGVDAKISGLEAGQDTVYRIGSVSKLFTDIVVMQYVEQGILDLDVPVTQYLQDFKPRNPHNIKITLRMLMGHTSGLVREPPVGNYFDPNLPSLQDTVLSLNDTTLVYKPGTKVQYSNAGIAVVGRVVEKISGGSFSETLKSQLLRPLGMSQSAFAPEKHLLAKLPEAYMRSYHGGRFVAPTFELGVAPAGSMYASMNDLGLFMSALIKKGEGVNGRFLEEKTLRQMWSLQNELKSARNRSFGIGFMLGDLDGEKTVSHGGAIYGFSTQMKVVPGKKIGVAISTNLDLANGALNRIADHALRVLVALQDAKPLPEYMISEPVSDTLTKQVSGLYRNGDELIEVSHRFDDLYIDRVKDLSLRLRQVKGRIVIDDLVTYNDDIRFSNDKVTLSGVVYRSVESSKPLPVKPKWSDLIGEYGYDHNILYITEKYGKLHALIEWAMEYPLIDLGNGVFKFPPHGLYPNETLTFDRDSTAKVSNVSLNGVDFNRRSVGDIDGEVFKIKPVKQVKLLEQTALKAVPPRETGNFTQSDLVDVTKYADNIKLDIRYATKDNFLDTPVYSSARAFLQRPAAEALGRIAADLKDKGYGLLVHDAYRPWYVSKIFWDATPEDGKDFVADPSKGSRHNRGAAVDLTLYDLKTGKSVEMVGLYDEMTERSFPHYPGGTSEQRWNRDLLRSAMEAEGFSVYEYEWWHFDFNGWEQYRIQNDTFEALSECG